MSFSYGGKVGNTRWIRAARQRVSKALAIIREEFHKHICPQCGKEWDCQEAGKVWDQEDTDCRWFTVVWCNTCRQKEGI